MARLIDADALLDYFRNEHHESEVIEAVKDAPTIDAVPVVMCKDCKHWKQIRHDRGLCKHSVFTFEDDTIDPLTEHDDFCSYGERRTDVQLTD